MCLYIDLQTTLFSILKALMRRLKTLTVKYFQLLKKPFFDQKKVVTDSVKLSIERALLKRDAIYPYTESLNKCFIIQAGQNYFIKKNIFGTEPIRRLPLCMLKKVLFSGVLHSIKRHSPIKSSTCSE